MPLIRITRVVVEHDAIEAVVEVDPDRMRTSSAPGMAERALQLLPGLARHTCDNDANARFIDEMRDTETAHLLEHVACEFMALSGSPRSLRGETSWDFGRDGRGVFHVRLAYDNDTVAIGALTAAQEAVEWLFGEAGERPDVAASVERLRALR